MHYCFNKCILRSAHNGSNESLYEERISDSIFGKYDFYKALEVQGNQLLLLFILLQIQKTFILLFIRKLNLNFMFLL